MHEARAWTLTAWRQALRRGQVGVAEAWAWQRARFAAEAPRWRCTVPDRPASAARAARADGPLAGIGLAHKDVFRDGGWVPRFGTPNPWPQAPSRQATVLARLAARGAATLGGLALAEHACGATGESRHQAPPVNPVDAQAMVGGSSSGSAVAVAAGLCLGSLGTDTAGSVRIPAASCGCVGLKPGHGRLPLDGVCRLAPSLDGVGIVARSAEDAAQLWLGCLDPADAASTWLEHPGALAAFLRADQRWRVRSACAQPGVAPEVGAVLAAFEDRVACSGLALVATDLPEARTLARLAQLVLHVEAAAVHGQAVAADREAMSAAGRDIVLPGWAVPADWYHRALQQREDHRAAFVARHLGEGGVLLTPALPRPLPDWHQVLPDAPAFDARERQALHRHFAFVNYLGLPALVFPVGQDLRGRPVSVQAIAGPGEELALLAFAHRFAAASDAVPPPPTAAMT